MIWQVKPMNILDRIVNWFRVKRFMMTHKTKLFLWQSDGRKYLAVHETGWRGRKWSRKFEVVDEVDDRLQPMNTRFPEPFNLRSGD